MAGITLAQAQAQLDAWLEASVQVARNQSYSINGRSLTRADASDIQNQIAYWQSWVTRLTHSASGRSRIRYGVAE
ncbi:DUF6148 family protein [Oceaniradius stylonematis]|uniref:DUF6148 family protein n=1 Tax=Oceaniradius stylonematis TaxID=2184161 RepID=UPI003B5B1F0C